MSEAQKKYIETLKKITELKNEIHLLTFRMNFHSFEPYNGYYEKRNKQIERLEKRLKILKIYANNLYKNINQPKLF